MSCNLTKYLQYLLARDLRSKARMEIKPKLVCAWCRKVLRDGPSNYVSHGICVPCRLNMERQIASARSFVASVHAALDKEVK